MMSRGAIAQDALADGSQINIEQGHWAFGR